MEEQNKVKLHGTWISTYSKRVELALRVKGIPYDYLEEDLSNKSPLLFQYNPVHKKIPVLVHNGKPIPESSIILEYIDETWKNAPRFLPEDPYQRAQIRFWAGFIQQVFEAMGKAFMTSGEAQEKAIEETHEKINVLEEGMKGLFSEEAPKIDGQNFGLLDIMVCAVLSTHKASEEVLGNGVKILHPERHPFLSSWVEKLNKHPVVKENTPPYDKIIVLSTHKASEEVLGNGVKILHPERHPFLSSWVEKLNKHPVVKENTPPYDKIIGFLHFITHKTKESRVC
ncbi:hypothetical protein WN944_013062 [Citrus x changshan-huyou]|uniref:Glutathione S-transferase U10 n=2 Tax=Citrus TaxID=2706 RepID=A0ACB8LQR6_CITSI|nr:glutathione S-transferase U10 [Citrus sinensis]